jgi:hypothetical protein
MSLPAQVDQRGLDGVLPYEPFQDLGMYSVSEELEEGLWISREIGNLTVDVEIAIGTAGLSAEANAARSLRLVPTSDNIIKQRMFMWGTRGGPHVHLGPGRTLMKHHLRTAADLRQWWFHAMARGRRFFGGG